MVKHDQFFEVRGNLNFISINCNPLRFVQVTPKHFNNYVKGALQGIKQRINQRA